MLGSHPEIASPQETDLFNRYVVPFFETWDSEVPDLLEQEIFGGWQRRRYKGLPAIITRDELIECLRVLTARIYSILLARKSSATIVLEKNPEYSLCVDAILDLAPHARFIHLVRDGRDVTISLKRVASSWGWWWAPSRMADAARRWRNYVEGAQRASSAPGGYFEIRYEELASQSGPKLLEEVFGFCGVRTEGNFVGDLFRRYQLNAPTNTQGGLVWGGVVARHVRGEPEEPPGFVSDSFTSSWQKTFTAYDRRLFDNVAGEWLVRLGYEQGRAWSRTGGLRGLSADTRVLGRELLARLKVGV